jgi:hypothetical protein
VSTTALHIIELVKSLPLAEQRAICRELAKRAAALNLPLSEAPDEKIEFTAEDREGLDDDAPFFRIMAEIESARHAYHGRPAPPLD